MDIIEIEKFIDNHEWTFAKSMPKMPHEYICKDYLSNNEKLLFEQIVQYIRDFGTPAYFFKKQYIYLKVEDHYYWTMGNPIAETTILNRAHINKYQIKCVGDYNIMEMWK